MVVVIFLKRSVSERVPVVCSLNVVRSLYMSSHVRGPVLWQWCHPRCVGDSSEWLQMCHHSNFLYWLLVSGTCSHVVSLHDGSLRAVTLTGGF